ncbi:MAG: fused MFS/spermidine synthase, partial [Anaerolineae bacterium]
IAQPALQQRIWNPCIVVFISNACVMTLEIAAGRIIAPQLGVSLYSWTSVIGVVLAGISIGNYLGGRLADRFRSLPFLGFVLALSAVACLAILPLRILVNNINWPITIPLLWRIVAHIMGLFLLPSLILGMISPIIVKLSLNDLSQTGATVGKIYAWSAIGSVVGTFASGFWLISAFGTKMVIILIACILALLAVWFLTASPWKQALPRSIIALGLFGAFMGVLFGKGMLNPECTAETNYFCIQVFDYDLNTSQNRIASSPQETDGTNTVRAMMLDRMIHGYSDIDDPTNLLYDYERTYAAVLEPFFRRNSSFNTFIIGGGAYTFPRYIESRFPQATILVAEIDPAVTQVAIDLMGLSPTTRIQTRNLDARILVQLEGQPDSYDLIFGDAFNDYSVPFHLTTMEFSRKLADMLRPGGLYVANIVESGRYGRFLRAYTRTLQRVFRYVQVIPTNSAWRTLPHSTIVIIASQEPYGLSQLPGTYLPLPQTELDAFLALEPALILTDDFVPVDNLMAPVFEGSWRSEGAN